MENTLKKDRLIVLVHVLKETRKKTLKIMKRKYEKFKDRKRGYQKP